MNQKPTKKWNHNKARLRRTVLLDNIAVWWELKHGQIVQPISISHSCNQQSVRCKSFDILSTISIIAGPTTCQLLSPKCRSPLQASHTRANDISRFILKTRLLQKLLQIVIIAVSSNAVCVNVQDDHSPRCRCLVSCPLTTCIPPPPPPPTHKSETRSAILLLVLMVPFVEVNIKYYQATSCQARHQIPAAFAHTTILYTRDDHGNGIPNGNGNPMWFPR